MEHVYAYSVGRAQRYRRHAVLAIRKTASLFIVGVLSSLTAGGQSISSPREFLRLCVAGSGPVLNTPYSAKRRFTTIKKLPDGTTVHHSELEGSEARDSQGRTYKASVRHSIYRGILKSETLYRLEDPVANTSTSWEVPDSPSESISKVVKIVHWPEAGNGKDTVGARIQEMCDEARTTTSGDTVGNLGAKIVDGVVAEGTRSSYSVPAGQDGNNQPITVVDEFWYSPDLKIVVLETNNDPLSGSWRYELIDIVRGKPDVTKYKPPTDYVIREVRIPIHLILDRKSKVGGPPKPIFWA